MRIGAIISALLGLGLFIMWLEIGIDEALTIQQAIMCGAVLASGLIAISNIEK